MNLTGFVAVHDPLASVLLLAFVGCTSPHESTTAPHAASSTMRVHCIAVGQGAATLFEFADGAVLVDTGGEDNATVHSDAMLGAYLDRFFEGRPDLHHELSSLILTHPHIDHTRGVSVGLAKDPPRNIVTNGQTAGSGSAEQNALRQWAVEHHVPMREVHLEEIPSRGLTDNVIDPVHGTDVDPVITVLWAKLQPTLDGATRTTSRASRTATTTASSCAWTSGRRRCS